EGVADTGIATFVSAGNFGPGTFNDKAAGYNVIAVGAWDSVTGAMGSFSSSATIPQTGVSKPDISAPGVAVPSPWGTYDGTSPSAPIAAGVAAAIAGHWPGYGYAPTMKSVMMVMSSKSATGTKHAGANNSIVVDRDGVGVIDLSKWGNPGVGC